MAARTAEAGDIKFNNDYEKRRVRTKGEVGNPGVTLVVLLHVDIVPLSDPVDGLVYLDVELLKNWNLIE